ncbi:MAG: methyltransferase family protein [Promethearchaeota archaeon]
MLNIEIVGPVVFSLSTSDVLLHLYLDFLKVHRRHKPDTSSSTSQVPQIALLISALTTIIAFVLVFVLSISWLLSLDLPFFLVLLVSVDSPPVAWSLGLVILGIGILLHGWSRVVRRDLASNWDMDRNQPLFTTGPYSQVRHPSYTSYFLSFSGLFLLIPSVLTLLLFLGVWGYNEIAKMEEENLVRHFGEKYTQYMLKTGRFLPLVKFREKN